MKKIQEAITVLIYNEPFYGHLISRMRISKSDSIPSAGVNITDKINLVYNEEWLEKLEIVDITKVLKHECEHILREHILRSKQIGINSDKDHKKFNIAADATINVADLLPMVDKVGGVTVEKLNETMLDIIKQANEKDKGNRIFTPMEKGQLAEYYYNRINQFVEENSDILPESGLGETTDDHSSWEKSEGSEELLKEITKEAVNSAVKNCGGIGNIPNDIASLVSNMNKSQVNWRSQLRQFYVNTLKSTRIPTRKKRNRRYGILQPGVKKKEELSLGLCVDTSGSVSDEELGLFWAEINAINSLGVKIIVIEADCEVKNCYEYDKNKTPSFVGRGGTAYNPAIEKALELKVDGIMYFGDFDTADTPKNPKKPFLWVGVRRSPPPADFGRVIYLE